MSGEIDVVGIYEKAFRDLMHVVYQQIKQRAVLYSRYEYVYKTTMIVHHEGHMRWDEGAVRMMDFLYMELIQLTMLVVWLKLKDALDEPLHRSGGYNINNFQQDISQAFKFELDNIKARDKTPNPQEEKLWTMERSYQAFPFGIEKWMFTRTTDYPMGDARTKFFTRVSELLSEFLPLIHAKARIFFAFLMSDDFIRRKVASALSRTREEEGVCYCMQFTKSLYLVTINAGICTTPPEPQELLLYNDYITLYLTDPAFFFNIMWNRHDGGRAFLQSIVSDSEVTTTHISACHGVRSLKGKITTSNVSGKGMRGGDVLMFTVHWVNVASKPGLEDPHILAFVTHGCTAEMNNLTGRTRLERMYQHCRGDMEQVGPDGNASFALRLERDPPPEARLYFVVFYKRKGGNTVCDEYELEAHGNHHLPKGEENGLTVYALAGPLGESMHYNPESFEVLDAFETAIDCALVVSFDKGINMHDRGEKVKEETSTTDKRKSIVEREMRLQKLDGVENEKKRIKFFDKMIDYIKKHTTEGHAGPQTYAYQGFPTENLDVIAAIFIRPPEDKIERYEFFVTRALAAKGFTGETFSKLCLEVSGGNATEWTFNIFRQVVCMAINIFNMLIYRNDFINRRQVDQMQTIRMVGQGDCEDSDEAIYKWIQRFQLFNESDFHNDATKSLHRILAQKYIPCYTIMLVTYGKGPTMHAVCSLMPRHKFGSGIEYPTDKNVLPILLEGTNATESNFHSLQEMKHCLKEQEIAPVEKSVAAATRVWQAIEDAVDNSKRQGQGEDAEWMAPRPPATYKGKFYKGFIALCCEPSPGKATYYRFVKEDHAVGADSTHAKLPSGGVNVIDVMQGNKFKLVNPHEEFTMEFARANAYIADYTLPVPLVRSESDMVYAPMQQVVTELTQVISKLCGDFNNSQKGARPLPGGDYTKCKSVTMTYNICASEKGVAADEQRAVHSLRMLLGGGAFKNLVAWLDMSVFHVVPCIPVISITCFLKT